MKKILIVCSTILGLFYISSCSNDFELIADWKDIPAIYCLISKADTAVYVRVEKAYLDPETSAVDIAQVADSLYYPNATVRMVRSSNSQEYVFTKIDGNNDGYPREEGVFADTPNWLYKYKFDESDPLREGEKYELIIRRNENSEPVTSEAVVVSKIDIKKPTSDQLLKFLPGVKTDFRWSFNKDDAIFFDLYLNFYYEETIDGAAVEKSFQWPIVRNEPQSISSTGANSSSIFLDILGEEFFQAVADNIDGSNNVPRKFLRMEVEVIGGGQELFDYLQVNQANRGLTSSQVIPNFTNFSEGYGLFSSIGRSITNPGLAFESLDFLRDGVYTEHLNFQ